MAKSTVHSIIWPVVLAAAVMWGNDAHKALGVFEDSLQGINTYTVEMSYRQVRKNRSEERTVNFSYSKPGWVRIDVLEGKDTGSSAVYDPHRDRVLARRSWMPAPLAFSPDALPVTTLRDERIYDASFAHMLERARWYRSNGKIICIGDQVFDNKECKVIEFTTTDTEHNRDIARERWWLDKHSGFPCRVVAYDSEDIEVIRLVLKDLRLNVELPADHFRLSKA